MAVRATSDAFLKFGEAFPSLPWRPYLVRWMRDTNLQFAHRWVGHVEIEVTPQVGFVRIWLGSRSRSRLPLMRRTGFTELQSMLEGQGFELRSRGESSSLLFMKHFRPSGPGIYRLRSEVEGQFRFAARGRRPVHEQGGIPGAILQFLAAEGWTPACCGWSRRLRLRDGTSVLLAVLLSPGAKRYVLHPESYVIVEPPRRASAKHLAQLTDFIRSGGYRGEISTSRARGGKPSLFGAFQRTRLGPGGPAAERWRLDDLWAGLRRRWGRSG